MPLCAAFDESVTECCAFHLIKDPAKWRHLAQRSVDQLLKEDGPGDLSSDLRSRFRSQLRKIRRKLTFLHPVATAFGIMAVCNKCLGTRNHKNPTSESSGSGLGSEF